MMYSFVALDLDGTLLCSNHSLSDYTIQTLRKLSSLGVTICLATGRSIANIIPLLDELDLPQESIPVVCFNGAVGINFRKQPGSKERIKEVLFENPIHSHLIDHVIEFSEKEGCVLQYYDGSKGDVYAVPKNEEHKVLLGKYASLVLRPQVLIDSYEIARSIVSQPAKMLILTHQLDEIHNKILSTFSSDLLEQFNIIRGSPEPSFFIEFLNNSVSKGNGVEQVLNVLNIKIEQAIAFGDGDNDKEMIASVGLGCAMKNANQGLKEIANVVLEHTNNEDGVAKFLNSLLNDGKFIL